MKSWYTRDLMLGAVAALIIMLGQSVVDGSMAATIISIRPSACRFGLFQTRCRMQLRERRTTPDISKCGVPPPSPRCKDGKTMMRFTCVADGAGYKWQPYCPPVAEGMAESQAPSRASDDAHQGTSPAGGQTESASPSHSADSGQGISADAGAGVSATGDTGWHEDKTCMCYPAMGMANWTCANGTIGGPHCGRKADGTCGYFINNCPQQR